jgi:hypothetical protein
MSASFLHPALGVDNHHWSVDSTEVVSVGTLRAVSAPHRSKTFCSDVVAILPDSKTTSYVTIFKTANSSKSYWNC